MSGTGADAPQAHSQLTTDATVLLCLAAAVLAWDLSGLDLVLSRWFGTPQGFAWRDHWFTSEWMHAHARQLGWALLATLAVNVWKPLPFARALTRSERAQWLASTVACACIVPLIKHVSTTSCPWSLAEFGGTVARYVPHWVLHASDAGPGGCFPSGHASTAFSFCGGWFALRARAPRAARWWLLATVLSGALLGWVQVMRGAHYLSHPLWTAWICWTASTVLAQGPPLVARFARQQMTPASP